MTEQSERIPRSFTLFSVCILTLGLGAAAISWAAFPPVLDLRLLLIVLGAALSEFFLFSFPIYSMSLAFPLSMAAAILGGPASACLVSFVSSVNLQDIRNKRPAAFLCFNIGQLLLSTAVGAWSYLLIAGRVLVDASGQYHPLVVEDFPNALIGMIVGALLSYGINFVLTSTGAWLSGKASFRAVFVSGVALIPTQLALAFVGFLMAQVLSIAAVTLPLFVFPLAIGRQFYQSYLGLRDAYRDTIRSLVGALETKDPYTRGHSVRVAVYATETGRAMGLDESALEKLEYAALLHDLGKLSMSCEILTKPDALTASEMRSMREHPATGAAMVERIPPLRGLAQYVMRHHEWYGGGGYPDGCSEDEIPALSRILSVADAYDAMTTTRAYRKALSHEDAMSELLSGAGTQFDPEVVAGFAKARLTAEAGVERPKADALLSTDPAVVGP